MADEPAPIASPSILRCAPQIWSPDPARLDARRAELAHVERPRSYDMMDDFRAFALSAETSSYVEPAMCPEVFTDESTGTETRISGETVKFAESDEWRIPRPLERFSAAIRQIAEIEAALSPLAHYRTAQIWISQGMVEAGDSSRIRRIHRDTFETRIEGSTHCDHIYIIAGTRGTLRQPSNFDPENEDEKPSRGVFYHRQPWDFMEDEPLGVNLHTRHHWHAGPIAEKDEYRTFLAITFSTPMATFTKHIWPHRPKAGQRITLPGPV